METTSFHCEGVDSKDIITGLIQSVKHNKMLTVYNKSKKPPVRARSLFSV